MKSIISRTSDSIDNFKPAIRMGSSGGGTVDSSQDDSNSSSLLDVSGHSIKSCLAVKNHRESSNDRLSTSVHSVDRSDRSVRFDTVEFREYPIILCDNPSASGPPIGLGWGYDPKNTLQAQVDAYEAHRDGGESQDAIILRRTKGELRIPPHVREGILLDAGYSRSEIRAVVQMSGKDKKRRNTSENRHLDMIAPILKGVESVKLGMKRSVSLPSFRLGRVSRDFQDSDLLDDSLHSSQRSLDRTHPQYD